jgi:PAS domain S-box-containing protein
VAAKLNANQVRWKTVVKDRVFDSIRQRVIIETQAEQLLAVLQEGTVSTNVFLRKLHNFALDMDWQPGPVLSPKHWPTLPFQPKRGLAWEEHTQILAAEKNPERRLFYDLLWETGTSQSDAAALHAESIDWPNRFLRYCRMKTGTPACLAIGPRLEVILRALPAQGHLFPTLGATTVNARSAEFWRRCKLLGIKGVSLHSYRYGEIRTWPSSVRSDTTGVEFSASTASLRGNRPDSLAFPTACRGTWRHSAASFAAAIWLQNSAVELAQPCGGITVADKVGIGSLKQKCRHNLAAIELLKQLEEQSWDAAESEKRLLVRYVGWGGLPQVFGAWKRAVEGGARLLYSCRSPLFQGVTVSTLTDQPSPAVPAAAATAPPGANFGPPLRQRAEAAFRERAAQLPADRAPLSPEATQRLLHELQVHQIELEMQNEELRQSQTALTDVETRYFDLYDLAPVGYLTVSEKGLIRETNLTAATLLGVGRSALVQQPFTRFIVPADQDIFYLCRRQLLDTSTPQACELRLARADGLTFWAHLAATVAPDATGASECRVTLTNATGRKQAEDALRLSEDKFAQAFRASPDAIIVSSMPDSRITEANASVSRISGYAPEELLGKTTVELGLWADPGVRDRYVDRVRSDGRVVDFEAVFRTKSGVRRTCLMSTEIIQLATGPHFLSVLRDITEQKQAEAQARRWQQVFTAAGFALAHSDVATNTFLEVNDRCARQLGYMQSELVGQPITSIYPPEEIPAMRERLKYINQAGHVTFESVHRRKDGSTFPVLVDVTTICDTRGRPVSRVAYALDITRRKEAEAKLRESEARYRLLAENGSDVIWLLDLRTQRFAYTSPAVFKLRGFTPEEVSQHTLADTLTPESCQKVATLLPPRLAAFAAGDDSVRSQTHELDMFRRDGSIVQVEVATTIVADEHRQATHIQGVTRDLTERKQAEDALRLFKTLVESAEEAVAISDLAGELIYINPAHEKLFGYSLAEARRLNYRDLYPPESLAVLNQVIAPKLARGESWEGELEVFDRAGRRFPLWERAGTVRDAAGKVLYAFGFMHDITERRQAEERSELLRKLGFALAASSDLPATLRLCLDTAIKIGGMDAGGIYLAEEPSGDLQLACHVGLSADFVAAVSHFPADSPNARWARAGKIFYGQARTQGRPSPTIEEQEGLRALSLFPVLYVGRLLAVLNVTSHTVDELTPAARMALETVTGLLGGLLHRLRAEQALQESERRLADLMSNLPGMAYRCRNDRARTMEFVSESCQSLTGYSSADLTDNAKISYAALIHLDDREAICNDVQQALARRERFLLNYRLQTAAGETRWVWEQGLGVYSPDGTLLGLEGFILDVTEQKQTEQALQAREAQLKLALDAGLAITWEWDIASDTIRYPSNSTAFSRGADQTPYSSRESLAQQIHPDDRVRLAEVFQRTKEEGVPFDCEYRVRLLDGAYHWVMAKGQAAKDSTGRVARVAGVLVDVSERKEAEVKFKETAFLLAEAQRIARVGYYVNTIADGRWESSPVLDEIFGIDADYPRDVAGWVRLIHPEDQAAAIQHYSVVRTVTGQFRLDYRVIRPSDGAVRWVAGYGQVEYDAERKPVRMVGCIQDITERKLAEAALHESEERFRNLLRDVPRVAVQGYRMDGTTTYWNHASEAFYGYTGPEAMGRNLMELVVPPEMREDVRQAMRQMAETGQPIPASELTLMRKDGSRMPVFSSHVVVQIPGRAAEMFCLDIDLTDRKRLEESLRELNRSLEQRVAERTAELSLEIAERRQTEDRLRVSEQRHRDLVETMPDWVWEVDERGVFTFAGPQCNDLLGYAPEEILGRNPFDFMPPEEAERVASLVLPVKARGEPIQALENVVRRKDGRLLTVETNGVPVRDATGKLRGYCGLDHDITERKQAEAQLRKLHSAVEHSPTVVVITDAAGTIEYVNPQFTVQTGYTAAEAVGQNPRVLKSGHHPSEFFAGLWRTLLAGHHWRGELCNKRKDGTLFWESTAIAPIRDSAGRLTHFVAIKEDITERRRVAEELRQAKDAAEAANRAKSTFLANVSHEVRTPLNAILGFTQLLREDRKLSAPQQQQLSTISRNGEHLLKVINEILEMARIEAGRVTLNPAPFDLHLLLEDLERTFSLRASAKQLRFGIERRGALPRHLLADGTKLKQVFINLLGNAVKFTPDGGAITLRVWAEAEPDGQLRLHGEVEDTGTGIAPEDIPHLFEAFFQTEAGRREAGGTGLGLSIIREFVRLMGGDFHVTSQVGVGSRFAFDVRVSRTEEPAPPAETVAPPAPLAAAPVPDEAVEERPTVEAIRQLPDELVAALREATRRADYAALLALAERAAVQDERLGRQLRQLVKRFDYAALQQVLLSRADPQ